MNFNYKTFLLACIFSLTCYGLTNAQTKIISDFEIFGGSSYLHNTGYLGDSKQKFGSTLGVGISHSFSKSFKINVRESYDTKGSVFQYNYGLSTSNNQPQQIEESINTTFKYFTTTVTPTFLIGKRKLLSVGIGAYYGHLAKTTMQYTRVIDSSLIMKGSYGSTGDNGKSLFNHQYDYGTSITAGYYINLYGKTKVLIQATETFGFVDMNNVTIGSQRNRSFTLSAAFVLQR